MKVSSALKAALLGAVGMGAGCMVAGGQTYHAVGEYKLPGASARGLAVDTAGRRLFVAGDQGITVLNADTGATVGTIALKNADDVLLIPVRNGEEAGASTRGFATAGSEVVSFSIAAMKATPAGKLPTVGASSLCYDPEAKTVEAVSAGGSLATFNADTGKGEGTHKVATGAGQIACGTLDHVYVADTANNVVHVLNHETGKNDGDFPIMTGHKPSGITLDTKGRRLFVTCEDGVVEIIDTDSGFTFLQLKAGSGAAGETFAWTPQGKGQWKAAAFIAQQDGTLTGVKMNAYINYSVGGTYKLSPGLSHIAYDEKTHQLYMTAVHDGAPSVIVAGYSLVP